MKSILDPTFKYVPSEKTDIRKTFERVRRELAEVTADQTCKHGNIKPCDLCADEDLEHDEEMARIYGQEPIGGETVELRAVQRIGKQ